MSVSTRPDPQLNRELLKDYLVGDGFGMPGFLARMERELRVSSGRSPWRKDALERCRIARQDISNGTIDPDVLLPLITWLQKRTGSHCDHEFRRWKRSSYDAEGTLSPVRECKKCRLICTSEIVPDARCEWCRGPVWGQGAGLFGPTPRICGKACRQARFRDLDAQRATA